MHVVVDFLEQYVVRSQDFATIENTLELKIRTSADTQSHVWLVDFPGVENS